MSTPETPAVTEPTTYPDVRVLPTGVVAASWSGRRWVFLHRTARGALALDGEEPPLSLADAQRMVPVGPLFERLAELDQIAEQAQASVYRHDRQMSIGIQSSADHLRTLLASLTGEAPDA